MINNLKLNKEYNISFKSYIVPEDNNKVHHTAWYNENSENFERMSAVVVSDISLQDCLEELSISIRVNETFKTEENDKKLV